VACKQSVPASRVIAEFLGKAFLSFLNKPFGCIGKFFPRLLLSLSIKYLFLSLQFAWHKSGETKHDPHPSLCHKLFQFYQLCK